MGKNNHICLQDIFFDKVELYKEILYIKYKHQKNNKTATAADDDDDNFYNCGKQFSFYCIWHTQYTHIRNRRDREIFNFDNERDERSWYFFVYFIYI